MISVFINLVLALYLPVNKCSVLLSSPHDFCICVKNMHVFTTNENGSLEKWLKINNHKVVQKVYNVAANTQYLCPNVRTGDMFQVVNGSWFCKNKEFKIINNTYECYN